VPEYILDACALIALFDDEAGADIVDNLLDRAKNNELDPVERQGYIPFLWIRPHF
jgi:PIN domain nuclease of toxin-antitoxin system